MSKQSANFKLFVVRQRERDNASVVDLAKMYGVDYAMIRTWWQRLYDEGGGAALEPRPKGRPSKMKKPTFNQTKKLC